MITANSTGAYYDKGRWTDAGSASARSFLPPTDARRRSIAWRILKAHSQEADNDFLRITFDSLASHDITYVGIVQTARASGLRVFPVPYILTNCHNSLCAVGGTINEDDHLFGLSAAKKYGGDYVPSHMAVIHQYMREMHAGCGGMILGSDSHTRYGALGCMGVGEGGPELVKQLLGRTYDLPMPKIIAVCLTGAPRPGVGPHDVALSLIKAVFSGGLVKNSVLEFIGPGVGNLSVDYRMGIDVMTTETTCLSSIWQTDDRVREWLAKHGREKDYRALAPDDGVWYDGVVSLNLDEVEPMIALPFHPSNAWSIREFLDNADDLLADVEKEAGRLAPGARIKPDLRSKLKNGVFQVDQGIVAGCSGGTHENILQTAAVLEGQSLSNGPFSLSVYPASQPLYLELLQNGRAAALLQAGATMRTAFCGPCFGAGDVPAHNAFSIRHTTRNFPNREGSRPGEGQISYVALMDARSIAATAVNGGRLTPATELPHPPVEAPKGKAFPYSFHGEVYERRVYRGFGKADPDQELVLGPNIADWPSMPALPENLLLFVASAIYDKVTTTDELIPSGETSSYRSNPLRLAEFTLSRKDPQYVGRAKAAFALEETRRLMSGKIPGSAAPSAVDSEKVLSLFKELDLTGEEGQTGIGSLIFARKPGDGSAREQAASCQRVLGGCADIASEYATKRYRSNVINWGMLPFVLDDADKYNLQPGDRIVVPGVRQALLSGLEEIPALLHRSGKRIPLVLRLPDLSKEERDVILAGCLINYYAGA